MVVINPMQFWRNGSPQPLGPQPFPLAPGLRHLVRLLQRPPRSARGFHHGAKLLRQEVGHLWRVLP